MRMRKMFLIALALSLLLPGCVFHKRPRGQSFIGAVPDAPVAVIARDAAQRLADMYPPGRTSIHVSQAQNNDQAAFGATFENEWRAHGFRIVPEPGNGPDIVWTIDYLGHDIEPSIYALFRITDQEGRKTVSRVYDKDGRAVSSFAQGIAE